MHIPRNQIWHTVHHQAALCTCTPDDIVIFFNTGDVHILQLKIFFLLFHDADDMLKLTKCSNFTSIVKLLLHALLQRSLKIATQTTSTVCFYQFPASLIQLWSIHGHYNVFKRFVSKLAHNVVSFKRQLFED